MSFLKPLSLERLEDRTLLAVRFAVFGDWGGSSNDPDRVSTMVHHASWDTDFVVTTGDNNYGQIDVGHADWENRDGARYGDFMLRRSDNKYPLQTSITQRFFPVVGNHDGTATGTGQTGLGGLIPGYIDYFVTNPGQPARLGTNVAVHSNQLSYYDVRWESIHLFAVDSDHARSNSAARTQQQQWLATAMAASDAAWKFVVLHHPPFSSSSVHGSDPAMQWDFAAWGADAVFAGHDHTFERIVGPTDDLLYFVTGLGGRSIYGLGNPVAGSQFRYNDAYGSMRVTVDGDQATFEFLSTDDGANGANGGRVVDSVIVRKSTSDPPPIVQSVLRNDGANLPDLLRNLQFTFSQNVSLSLAKGDLTLREVRSTAPHPLLRTVFLVALSRWDFVGENLPAGFYEVTLLGTGVENPAGTKLDGNQDGIPGDSWQQVFLVAPKGDANLDGAVDGTDWEIWTSNLNRPGEWQQADFNRDGVVNNADFTLWNLNKFTDVRPRRSSVRIARAPAGRDIFSTQVNSVPSEMRLIRLMCDAVAATAVPNLVESRRKSEDGNRTEWSSPEELTATRTSDRPGIRAILKRRDTAVTCRHRELFVETIDWHFSEPYQENLFRGFTW